MSETHALRLADFLSEAILEGRIAPGARLDEKTLAESHGLSRTPVREALTELCGRGLALRKPYRGVEVIAPDPAFLAQSFEALSEIEALCASLAAGRISISGAIALETLVERMAQVRQDGDHDLYRRLNTDLHDQICNACGNAQLAEIAKDLRGRFEMLRRAQLGSDARVGDSHDEHRQIVQAICDRDAQGAARAMRSHLRHAMAAALPLLPS
ncbi:GntR family transcriptional regulator [Paracoccus aminophilus]|uniref:Transcriptional regulator, GntR family n=1 Tax=Paracoccus aminophilus JCM 7686 TaxID=1367847 RepID=S5YVY3_PARAH|nr:GntR family transcriptional regulator [Paracoccus aminophilus]AGT09406.1 transcriptional regulator, GntR family [Paracoccus aminophilus JCM 7686]